MPAPLPMRTEAEARGIADAAALRTIIRHGSHSFHAASRLLPDEPRQAAFALYAFCRECDDIIDLEGGRGDAIAALHGRLDDAYEGRPQNSAVDRAFANTVAEYAIPKRLPAALIEGLSWDAAGRRYEQLEDVHDYAARVAGTVGAMMSLVLGARSRAALARATDLGIAMQLTNIARDVGEDARAGRIYLPLAWLREDGLDIERWLLDPHARPEIQAATLRLLDEADRFYMRGLSGITLLPRRCRTAIRAAGLIYADIGRVIRVRGGDSVTARAVVPSHRKLVLLAHALGGSQAEPDQLNAPPLKANRFLVDAAVGPTRPADLLPASVHLNPLVTMLELAISARERRRATSSQPAP